MYKSNRLGIRIQLKGEKGVLIEIASDGKVGDLPAGKSVTLVVVAEASDVRLINVDGKKNVLVRNSSSDHAQIFLTDLHVHSSANKVPYTRYPENLVRLMKVGENGIVEHWEISLVGQDGTFWITTQRTFDVACSRDEDGTFRCPQFAHEGDKGNWPQMVATLQRLLEGKELPLDIERGIDLRRTLVVNGELDGNTGVVRWYNYATQLGCVVTKGADVRVHFSQIAGQNGDFRCLSLNQVVHFDSLRELVVKEGQRPTGFKQEAIGVRVIG